MTECEHADAEHRPQCLAPACRIMRQRQRTRHHAKPERTHGRRRDIAMVQHAAAQRQSTQADRKAQPYLMKDVAEQDAARCRNQRQDDGRCDAMDQTKPRQSDRKPIKAKGPGLANRCRHKRLYASDTGKIQHHIGAR